MEETTVTTTEVSTEEQTTPDVEVTQSEETPTTEETTQEPETTETETTETESAEPTNWEKIAKDNQASFTKVSQEKAELTKRIEELENQLKPKIVNDGKISPEFEQKYKFDVDNQEYLAYDSLARQLDNEQRAEVEQLLREAQRLYNPNNNRAYEQKMAEVKDYFRADIVEQIALNKQNLIGKMKGEFDKAITADKQERANKVAQAIESVPELNELVQPDSENFSQEVFGIVKTMFDYTGNVDVEATTKAIAKIKDLGVKEYLAKQTAEKQKEQANVPTGAEVVQKDAPTITAEEASRNYNKYVEKFQKEGLSFKDAMAKVDAIIMKG